MHTHGDNQPLPRVTVVLPIRNEAEHIEACVLRLLQQDYPRHLVEILVVDGRSQDATREVVRSLQARFRDADLRLLDNPAGTVPQALNIGIRAASSDIIVRMDGHSVPASDYISACVRSLTVSGAANVGGYWSSQGTTPFGSAVARATAHPLGMGNARYRAGGSAGDVDTVPFGAFRRSVFERVGLFDESMVRNQDYEMNVRIRAAGERVYFDPSIRFTYTTRGDAKSLWRQYFQYGWWRVETFRRHPASLRWRQAIPPGFVATMIVLLAAAPLSAIAAWGLAALLGVYGSVVAGVSSRLARPGVKFLDLARAFVTLHFAYGLGFLLNVLTVGRVPYNAGDAQVPALQRPRRQPVGTR